MIDLSALNRARPWTSGWKSASFFFATVVLAVAFAEHWISDQLGAYGIELAGKNPEPLFLIDLTNLYAAPVSNSNLAGKKGGPSHRLE